MRKLLITAAFLLAASPVLAQPPADVPPPADAPGYADYEDEAPVIDPRQVDDVAARMDRMVGAIMSIPIGPIVEAVDPYGRGRYRPGDTIRDMATRDDPYAEERIRRGIQASARGMGAMTQALARAMPALRRSIEEVRRSMEQAIDEADGFRGD